LSRSAVCSSSVTTTSSSFRDQSPLQSSFARSPRSGPFGHDHRAQWSLSFTCLGFRPSSRHHTHAATSHETSQVPLRSVLRLSQPLDGLLRARACELVSSRCHVQELSVQGLLSPRSHPSSSEGACPLAVAASSLHAPASAFAETNALPRAMPLGFEAFICARPRSTSLVIHRARTRSPLQFSLPRAFSISDVSAVLLGTFRSCGFELFGLHALRSAFQRPDL
jgi:hypothetical protein